MRRMRGRIIHRRHVCPDRGLRRWISSRTTGTELDHMSDEMNGAKQPKSKTLGHLPVAKLAEVKEWKAFMEKAELAKKANDAHEKAKDAMRAMFRKTLKLAADADIEFSKTGDKITVTEILERKTTRSQAKDLSEMF